MALFSSSSSTPRSTPITQSEQLKNQIEGQISKELALANATELVSKISENCFQSCIHNPGRTLGMDDEKCVNQCLEKYMRSWNVISKTYIARIQNSS